jgi:outer membrane receptor protein involved in Fe transport
MLRVVRLWKSGVARAIVAAVLLLVCEVPEDSLAASQQDEASPDTVDLPRRDEVFPMEQIVVTATRTETPLDELPANVTVLTRSDIRESAATTVDDLLRMVPGFNLIRESNSIVSHPGIQSVNMRGLGATPASRTLVLLNGVPLNDPFGGWVHWSRIPLENVERVEVVKGGGSEVWGNRALGGVINIITERPSDTSLKVSGQGGSYSTVRTFASGAFRRGGLAILAAGEFFDTDGYPVVRPDQRGPIDGNAYSDHVTAGGTIEYAASPNVDVRLGGSYYGEDRNAGTPLRYNSTEIAALDVRVDLRASDESRWQIAAFGGFQKYVNFTGSSSPDRSVETPALDQFDVPSDYFGSNLQWSKTVLGGHALSAGTDLLWVEGETNEQFLYVAGEFRRLREAGGQQLMTGFYVQDVFPIGRRVHIKGSGRLDVWQNYAGRRVESDLSDGADGPLLDETYNDRTDVRFNYSVGARIDATQDLSVRATSYTGFRAPTLNELYKPYRASGGVVVEANPDLGPENLIGFELGADYRVSSRLFGRLTTFWNRVQDAIAEATIEEAGSETRPIAPCGIVPAGGVCRQRENLGTFRGVGFEAEVDYRPWRFWQIQESYLFNPTEIIEASGRPEVEGASVPAAPENQFVLRVAYKNPAVVFASLQGRYVGTRFEDDLNNLPLDAFFVMDLRLSRAVFRWLDLYVGAENLLDTEYGISLATNGLVRMGSPRIINGGLRVGL